MRSATNVLERRLIESLETLNEISLNRSDVEINPSVDHLLDDI